MHIYNIGADGEGERGGDGPRLRYRDGDELGIANGGLVREVASVFLISS